MTGPEPPDGTVLDITLRALRRLLHLPPVHTSADVLGQQRDPDEAAGRAEGRPPGRPLPGGDPPADR